MKLNKEREKNISYEILITFLDYSPETGEFVWKKRLQDKSGFNKKYAGKKAGSISDYGYLTIRLFKSTWFAHRLAWVFAYKKFPENTIDHINNIRLDNRISNLRDVSVLENNNNAKLPSSGHKWIYEDTYGYEIRYKTKNVGWSKTLEEAKNILENYLKNIPKQDIEELEKVRKIKNEKRQEKISRENLLERYFYEKETGKWYFKKNGKLLKGNITTAGYNVIHIDEKPYFSHILAWYYMTGEWSNPPGFVIDHINCNRADNRFENLRKISHSENSFNTKSKNEFTGVFYKNNNWAFQISINKKRIRKQGFKTKEEARDTRNALILENGWINNGC
jgi:hypothetical protein